MPLAVISLQMVKITLPSELHHHKDARTHPNHYVYSRSYSHDLFFLFSHSRKKPQHFPDSRTRILQLWGFHTLSSYSVPPCIIGLGFPGLNGFSGVSLTASRPANPFVCCKDILSTFFVQVNTYNVVLGHFLAFSFNFLDGHQMDNTPGTAQFQRRRAIQNLMDISNKNPFSFNIFMFFGFIKY